MSSHHRTVLALTVLSASAALIVGCMPVQQAPAPRPYPSGRYSYTPAQPCQTTGSTKLTLAIVAPTWQSTSGVQAAAIYAPNTTPKALSDLAQAMKSDFLQVVTCRGYLVKGPFDTFDDMVFPDREASQLLLEPQINVELRVINIDQVSPNAVQQIINKNVPEPFRGTASVGGRVTLTLMEPVTNTRMWTKSIEIPYDTAAFETDRQASWAGVYSQEQMAAFALVDPGLGAAVVPKLEKAYGKILRTAENYLNQRELTDVAAQAANVRKRGVIGTPR